MRTCFSEVYWFMYEDLAKLIVSRRNSDEFSQQSDNTPLMEACNCGHVDVVRTLIQAGADVNALSSTRNTALLYACASGHLEVILIKIYT